MTLGRCAWALVCLTFLGSACQAAVPSAGTPTPLLEPSLSSTTTDTGPLPTPTRAPLSRVTPAIVVEPTPAGPTPTPVGITLPLPPERLALLLPGPGSQVTSPIRIEGRGGPARSELVHIRLLGEDGRVLARQTTFLYAFVGQAGPFYANLAFDIPLVAEVGRLEVSTDDPRSARLGHVTTVSLTLLSAGRALIYPAIDGPEQLAILIPRPDSIAGGGQVHVEGAGRTLVEEPITVALLSQGGATLDSEEIWLEPRGVGVTGTFAVDLEYSLPYPQWGLIALYEPAPEGSGFLHYTTLEVFLDR
jgi:hypothetical protein